MQCFIGELNQAECPLGDCTTICFAGCDFNCGFCDYKFHAQKSEFLMELKDARRAVELADSPVYFRGQPCLQKPALLELARQAKKAGRNTGMDYNGSKPECLHALLREKLISFVRMELPAPLEEKDWKRSTRSETFFISSKEVIENVRKSLELLRQHQDDVEIEFETTITPGMTYRIEDLLKIAKEIRFIRGTWILKPFKPAEGLLDMRMKDIDTPTEGFLRNLRKAILKEHHSLRIRIEGY